MVIFYSYVSLPEGRVDFPTETFIFFRDVQLPSWLPEGVKINDIIIKVVRNPKSRRCVLQPPWNLVIYLPCTLVNLAVNHFFGFCFSICRRKPIFIGQKSKKYWCLNPNIRYPLGYNVRPPRYLSWFITPITNNYGTYNYSYWGL